MAFPLASVIALASVAGVLGVLVLLLYAVARLAHPPQLEKAAGAALAQGKALGSAGGVFLFVGASGLRYGSEFGVLAGLGEILLAALLAAWIVERARTRGRRPD